MKVVKLILTTVIFWSVFVSVQAKTVLLPKNIIHSKYLQFTPRIIVYLPDHMKKAKRYPVMYAHDGQNLFDPKTAFAGEWHLDENIEALQKQGLLGKIIVVGMYNTARRMFDYTPTLAKTEFGTVGGDLDKHANFLIKELKPYIDAHFPTLPDRKHTGVIGSSLGGLASFYLLGQHPDIFSKAAAISPSFWWDNVRILRDMKKMRFPSDVKIYIDGGLKEGADESGMCPLMRKVYHALKARGLKDFDNIFYYEDPAGTHSEYYWSKRGKMPLLFLFGYFEKKLVYVKPYLKPNILSVNKPAALSLNLYFTNHMPFTLLHPKLTFKGPNTILYKNGKIDASKSGLYKASYRFGKKDYVFPVYIFPHNNKIHKRIEILMNKPAKDIKLEIYKLNGMETNFSIPLAYQNNKTGIAALSMKKGTLLTFHIMNKQGKYAFSKRGNEIIRSIRFKKETVLHVQINTWKNRSD